MTWYGPNWNYRKEIALSSANVTAALSDFPFFIQITGDTDLANNTLSSGDDILFTESDGTTKLDHEIQHYESGAADLYAHVRIPSLDDTSDTTIYMYYGNAGASNQENPAGVWDTNYEGVWHLPEAASGTGNIDLYTDSTSSNNHGDDYVSATDKSGQLYRGQGFDNTDDYIELASAGTTFNYPTTHVSLWFKSTDGDRKLKVLSSRQLDHQDGRSWVIWADDGAAFNQGSIVARVNDGNNDYTLQSSSGFLDGEWHRVDLNAIAQDEIELYVDGVLASSTSWSASIDTSDYPTRVGGNPYSDQRYHDGAIDEVSISSSAKSADWISTAYNVETALESAISVGPQATGETANVISAPVTSSSLQTTLTTPASAAATIAPVSSSSVPIDTSDLTYLIDGTVTLPDSSTTSGVTVTAVADDESSITRTTTDSSGYYKFTENDLTQGNTYNILFRYEDEAGKKYNAEIERSVQV